MLLRDQSVEHVFVTFAERLSSLSGGHPTTTLIDVHTEALRWEEGMPGSGGAEVILFPRHLATSTLYKAITPTTKMELGELKDPQEPARPNKSSY